MVAVEIWILADEMMRAEPEGMMVLEVWYLAEYFLSHHEEAVMMAEQVVIIANMLIKADDTDEVANELLKAEEVVAE